MSEKDQSIRESQMESSRNTANIPEQEINSAENTVESPETKIETETEVEIKSTEETTETEAVETEVVAEAIKDDSDAEKSPEIIEADTKEEVVGEARAADSEAPGNETTEIAEAGLNDSGASPEPEVAAEEMPVEDIQKEEVTEPETESVPEIVEKTEAVAADVEEAEKPAESVEEIKQVSDQAELEDKPELDHKPDEELPVLDTTGEETDDEDEEDVEIEETQENFDELSREKLVELMEETVKETDVQKIKTKVALIKVAFLKQTKELEHNQIETAIVQDTETKEGEEGPQDPLMTRFNEAFEIYKRNKAKFNEDLELQKVHNLESKKQILEELRELVNTEESLKKTYDRFKELQTQWKEVGLVPTTEINNLWQNYHFLVEKFFDKVKISKELRDLDLKKNLEMKIELSEKAEELLLETSIIKSFKQLQKYHEEWKEIGPVPADKREEIWERFKTATDKINERRREYYSNLSEQQENNLLAKNALIDKAEQILAQEINSVKEWQVATNEINELFKIWKTIGPAPKKNNDEIWEKFKGALNSFFNNKKEYFSAIKQEQLNNYNLKLDICKSAENLKDSTDWKKTTQELINLQKEWKEIGPVPRKHSDKIWKRFRAACDEFFHNKSAFFSNIDKMEEENLAKKLELIRKIKEHEYTSDKNANLELLKGFQREWSEIGHVPIKEKDKIHASFREAINQQLDKLNISSLEMKAIDFKNKMETLAESPNANRAIRKEISFLSNKVSKLREDIHLWENNIGFLAHSKKADLLKAEFEKKIEKAKEELALSEAKLRYMQDSID